MKHILIGLALTALTPFSAYAATQPPAPGLPMADIAGGKNLSCATFSKLGTEAATRVLYYVNGYAAGIEDQIAAGTPSTNVADNTKVAPSPGPTSTPTATTTAAGSTGGASLSSLTAVTLDQLQSLCQAKPESKVLTLIPGGQPVTASGSMNGGAGATGTTAAGSAAAGTTATGTTTGNTTTAGGYNAEANTIGTGTAAGGTNSSGSAGSSMPAPTPPPTPPMGSVTVDPQTGLSTVTTGGGTTGGAATTAPTTSSPASAAPSP